MGEAEHFASDLVVLAKVKDQPFVEMAKDNAVEGVEKFAHTSVEALHDVEAPFRVLLHPILRVGGGNVHHLAVCKGNSSHICLADAHAA